MSSQNPQIIAILLNYFVWQCTSQIIRTTANNVSDISVSEIESTEKIVCCKLSRNPDDVQFFLYPDIRNSNVSEEIVYGKAETLHASQFKRGVRTILLTHGFRSDITSEMCEVVKNALLSANMSTNIIVVNWGALSSPQPPELSLNWYKNVVENVPVVGKRIGEFVTFLVGQGDVTFGDMYLIGHSMGAHVMGVAGKVVFEKTNHKVSRITGLDPAGPGFSPRKAYRNLMKEDAAFTDVIHTNMGKLGDMMRDGHADFYPNGGSSQPGCNEADDRLPSLHGTCSHHYAYLLYAASVKKTFLACPCPNYLTNYPEECPSKCDNPVLLGYPCPSTTNGEFYAKTGSILNVLHTDLLGLMLLFTYILLYGRRPILKYLL